MKNRTLLFVILFSFVSYIHAENQIAYVKLDYVMKNLPDTQRAELDFKAFSIQLDTQLQTKLKELQEEYESLNKGASTMTEEVKNKKEANFNRLRVDLENFQKECQDLLENKQTELIGPIRQRLQEEIEKIAKEKSYTYVLNTSLGPELDLVLYGKPELDISTLVLKRLGVDLAANAKAQQPIATPTDVQDKKAKKREKAKK